MKRGCKLPGNGEVVSMSLIVPGIMASLKFLMRCVAALGAAVA